MVQTKLVDEKEVHPLSLFRRENAKGIEYRRVISEIDRIRSVMKWIDSDIKDCENKDAVSRLVTITDPKEFARLIAELKRDIQWYSDKMKHESIGCIKNEYRAIVDTLELLCKQAEQVSVNNGKFSYTFDWLLVRLRTVYTYYHQALMQAEKKKNDMRKECES